MSYQAVLTPAQANAQMGWTPQRLQAYWRGRAQRCREFGDEGACLARVARHVPVTLGGMGSVGLGQSAAQTTADVSSLIAGLIANPNATLAQRGGAIVTALDTYVVGPVTDAAVRRATPYIVGYFGPPFVAMYVMVALSTWFSYQVFVNAKRTGQIKENRRRRKIVMNRRRH